MRPSSISGFLAAVITVALGVLALVALNNPTSTDALWPLSIVAAAGLISLGISNRAERV